MGMFSQDEQPKHEPESMGEMLSQRADKDQGFPVGPLSTQDAAQKMGEKARAAKGWARPLVQVNGGEERDTDAPGPESDGAFRVRIIIEARKKEHIDPDLAIIILLGTGRELDKAASNFGLTRK